MKPIARFVTRGTGDDGRGPVDLLLGVAFKGAPLLPNRVYEIAYILDSYALVDKGPAALGPTRRESQMQTSWMQSVDEILETYGTPASFVLTAEEYRALVEASRK